MVAALGLLLTGVLIPTLGLLAMLYAHGNKERFFAYLPKPVVFLLLFSMLALLGPIGVVPRCVIVAHGGVNLLFPEIDASLFNALFLVLILIVAWKKELAIEIIGKILTPWLLVGIALIIFFGLLMGPQPTPQNLSSFSAFKAGLLQGYQTMDLLAAFFFSATIVRFILTKMTPPTKTTAVAESKDAPTKMPKTASENQLQQSAEKSALKACLVGALSLGAVYLGFIKLGAIYAPVLLNVPGEKLLVAIAEQSLGRFALPLAAIIISLACLTTATVLATLFSSFVAKDILKKESLEHPLLILTLGLSYGISLFGFGPIAQWLQEILLIFYPALITYSVLFILATKTRYNYARLGFYITLFILIIFKVYIFWHTITF